MKINNLTKALEDYVANIRLALVEHDRFPSLVADFSTPGDVEVWCDTNYFGNRELYDDATYCVDITPVMYQDDGREFSDSPTEIAYFINTNADDLRARCEAQNVGATTPMILDDLV